MELRWWIRWAVGPIITVAATLLYTALIEQAHFPGTTVLLIPLIALAGLVNGSSRRPWDGLGAALVAAAWLTGYSVFLRPVFDIERTVLVPAGLFALAVIIGYLRGRDWQLRRLEEEAGELALDANLARLEEIERISHDLYWNFNDLSDFERRSIAKTIWDRANNIVSLAEGWRQVGRYRAWSMWGWTNGEAQK